MKKLILASSLVATLGLSAFAEPFTLDMANSKVDFSVKHMKLTKVDGSFKTFSANIDYDSATKTLKTLDGAVEIASVDTANPKRDAHLNAPDMFDGAKYPTMQLKMTKYMAI